MAIGRHDLERLQELYGAGNFSWEQATGAARTISVAGLSREGLNHIVNSLPQRLERPRGVGSYAPAGLGAAIGTFLLPGVGTLIGLCAGLWYKYHTRNIPTNADPQISEDGLTTQLGYTFRHFNTRAGFFDLLRADLSSVVDRYRDRLASYSSWTAPENVAERGVTFSYTKTPETGKYTLTIAYSPSQHARPWHVQQDLNSIAQTLGEAAPAPTPTRRMGFFEALANMFRRVFSGPTVV